MSGPPAPSDPLLAEAESAPPRLTWPRFFGRFLRLAGPYFRSGWRVQALVAVLVVLTIGQVAVQIAINLWTEQLFDAFGTRSMSGFVTLAGIFVLILLSNIVIVTTHLRLRRRIQIGWRQWLTERLTGEWMSAGRHYRMAYMTGDHDNPDGRIAEDARISTEAAIDLGHSLLYCVLLLMSFLNILWVLSGPSTLIIGEMELYAPGHLVWVSIIYAAVGIWIALLLGPPLITTAEARQTYEANFRFGLVHARENASAIALVHGESGERRRLAGFFDDVIEAWNRQTGALYRFYHFSTAWGVLSPVFPVLIAAPRFISGAITLGVLMQIAQAFQQTIAALSWPIDNLSHAAEWRASGERIIGLSEGIERVKQEDCCGDRDRIVTVQSDQPALIFSDLSIIAPDGEAAVHHLSATIRRGERVWISGDAAATTAVVRAMAGLWPWGRGRLQLPSDGPLFFLPPRSYLPPGPLRDAISYPKPVTAVEDAGIARALQRAGLSHLVAQLDRADNWDDSLSVEEHERVGVAQLLYHAPRWIVIQSTDGLNTRGEQALAEILSAEFADATVIVACHHEPVVIKYDSRLELSGEARGVGTAASSGAVTPVP